jgi:tetratricopeptide (TPR) repeat protein
VNPFQSNAPDPRAGASLSPGGAACRPGEIALIVCATLAAYFPALRSSFIWNDSDYVTQPSLRSVGGLWRIWFEVGATQQYYPLLHSAFWLEHRLWGDSPLGYHLANVLLHAAASCLFVAVLRRLSAPGAFFGGLIFALHPVCVESVAWISEEKNTLSTVFYLLSALVYLRWRERPEQAGGRDARPRLYFFALALFILALLGKSVTATLPAALLVVIWWRQGRLDWRRDILPLVPWFAAGAADGLFTAWVERTFIGAKGDAFALTLLQRTLVAGRAVWFYLGKLFWPAKLIFIYPRWNVDATAAWQYLFPLAALALLAGLWACRGRSRAPLAAALFFVGTLFPTLGFFNVFAFIFSYVADHFQYLAALGVVALVAGAWGRWAASRPPAATPSIAAAALLAVLGILTWRQSRMYRDEIAFYRTTLEQNPGSWMGHHNLGVLLAQAGRMPEAIAEYETALRIKPDDGLAEYDLGNALFKAGRTPEALEHYERALVLEPGYVKALYAVGSVLAQTGHIREAIDYYREAISINPAFPEAHYDLGNALLATGDLRGAIVEFGRAVQLQPNYVLALGHLGAALVQAGQYGDAVEYLVRSLAFDPGPAATHYNLGIALAQTNRLPEAVEQFQAAARLEPRDPDAQVNLALALAEVGRLPEAVAHCRAALGINPDFAPARELLGRLEAGR